MNKLVFPCVRDVLIAALSIAALAALILIPGEENFATCVMDKMQAVQNDAGARAVVDLCRSNYPGGFDAVQQGSGRGFFAHKSGAECATKKAIGTGSELGGRMIYRACVKLYND